MGRIVHLVRGGSLGREGGKGSDRMSIRLPTVALFPGGGRTRAMQRWQPVDHEKGPGLCRPASKIAFQFGAVFVF